MKNLRMIVDGGPFDVAEAIRELAAAVLALAPPPATMPDEKTEADPASAPAAPVDPKRTRAVKK